MDLGQLDRKEWESCFEDWCSAVQNVVAPHTYPMMKTFQYSMMGKPIHSLQKGAYHHIMLDYVGFECSILTIRVIIGIVKLCTGSLVVSLVVDDCTSDFA